MEYEYKVIPAPRFGSRRGENRGPAGRFSNAMEEAVNSLAQLGWEYMRAETLGVDEREGMMRRRVENFHSVLIFRRPRKTAEASPPEEDFEKPAPLLLTDAVSPTEKDQPRLSAPEVFRADPVRRE